jgi:hypothetical protein
MVRLVIRIVGTSAETGIESILALIESDHYDTEHLEDRVSVALEAAISSIDGRNEEALRVWQPEVSISLTADDENIRPSVHFSAGTLLRFARAGASFDFDPYV